MSTAGATGSARPSAFRDTLGIDATAYRLVHGEADGLPSLIVDRYADWVVLQSLSQATDRHLPAIVDALVELLAPKGILARNDPKVRTLEGLEQTVEVLYGEVPEFIEVREGPVTYQVDPRHGQKTGLFLDQRENREAAARYARGRLLDCFSYNGGFALYLANKCESVLALDASADAVGRITANAARNNLPHVTAREGNVFDELRYFERDGERFDTIVLDPPAFAKNKASVEKALSGYKDINLRALRLLTPGGVLVTCSCSYNVDEPLFLQVLAEAAADARAHVTILEKRMQGRDHPVLLTVPETFYLKCAILRKELGRAQSRWHDARWRDDTMTRWPILYAALSSRHVGRNFSSGTGLRGSLMGLDTRCSATFKKQTSVGRVQLETDHVLFRGDFRVKLALAAITGPHDERRSAFAEERRGHPGPRAGPAADKWAAKIGSPKSPHREAWRQAGRSSVCPGRRRPAPSSTNSRPRSRRLDACAGREATRSTLRSSRAKDLARFAALLPSLCPTARSGPSAAKAWPTRPRPRRWRRARRRGWWT